MINLSINVLLLLLGLMFLLIFSNTTKQYLKHQKSTFEKILVHKNEVELFFYRDEGIRKYVLPIGDVKDIQIISSSVKIEFQRREFCSAIAAELFMPFGPFQRIQHFKQVI